MQAEYFALEGISELISTLERVRAAFNPEVDDRRRPADHVRRPHQPGPAGHRNTARILPRRLFRTVIPRNIRLAEAPSHGKPVALYDPRSRGTEAYFELAGEFLARNSIESPKSYRAQGCRCGSKAQGREIRFWPYS